MMIACSERHGEGRAIAAIFAVFAVCSWTGCGEPESRSNADTREVSAAEVDRLRALPYAGFSPKKATAGEQGVVKLEPLSHPGYNLYSNRNHCSAVLIDPRGRPARSWQHLPGHHWTHSELGPGGDLLVAGMDTLERDERQQYLDQRYLLRLDWDGEVVWKSRLPAHHDVEITPAGPIMTLSMAYRRIPALHPDVDVRDNSVALLDPADGALIEEVSLYDLFNADPQHFPLQKVRVSQKGQQPEIDLFHANSIEWIHRPELEQRAPLYASGNVLVSIRHQDMIVIFDWQERALIWGWGRGEISGPHDATLLDNGHIMVFDNGLSRGFSRVLELDPVSETIVWEYRDPEPEEFFTASRGGSQRLSNGNTLITESDDGRVFEVTASGEIVWEFFNPLLNDEGHRASIVRLNRYETSFVEGLLRHSRRR